MRLWRICKSTWQDSIWSGIGGLHADGRWHQRGVGTIVYASDSLALAAWEIFVNFAKPLNDPPALVSAYADVPDRVSVSPIITTHLPPNWNQYPRPEELKAYGTDWREKGQTLLLRVPSAVISGAWNFLINPEHPEWQLAKKSDPVPFHFDMRTLLSTPSNEPKGSIISTTAPISIPSPQVIRYRSSSVLTGIRRTHDTIRT